MLDSASLRSVLAGCPRLQHALRFFFTATATTEIYTLSLHDALPISDRRVGDRADGGALRALAGARADADEDRKSTRLNSSHVSISYAVFCLKKKIARSWSTARCTTAGSGSSPQCNGASGPSRATSGT